MTYLEDNITFKQPVIFPKSDFRLEYAGEVKEGCVMHGTGTLILKDGKSYEGDWQDGVSQNYETELKAKETEWNDKQDADANLKQKEQEKLKICMFEEKARHVFQKHEDFPADLQNVLKKEATKCWSKLESAGKLDEWLPYLK